MRLSSGTGHRLWPSRGRRVRAALGAALVFAAATAMASCSHPPPEGTTRTFRITDYTRFVNNDQDPGEVFLRYPLGRIGLWSTPQGEIADSVTRGLRLYPTVDQVSGDPAADWRASVHATPAQATIGYGASSP